MLQKLYIKNYAIIDELEILFHPHFTVLTGETGAGKSIILGALSLILGERADTSILIDKTQKCIIEAVFDSSQNTSVNHFLTRTSFDIESTTRIRREINAAGKSRAFINDTPANLSQLQELGSLLVDLNRQFDNQLLHQTAYQFEIIDSFSANTQLIHAYRKSLAVYTEQESQLQILKEAEIKARSESEYLQFLFDELEQASFTPQEIETLEEKVKAAQHQEEIARVLSNTTYILSESEENILSQLRKITQELQSIGNYYPDSESLYIRLHSTLEEIKDIAVETDSMNGSLSFDQTALDKWAERMDLGFRLFKKHNCNNTAELLTYQSELAARLAGFESLEIEIEQMQQAIDISLKQLTQFALQLSQNRKEVIPGIVKNMEATLSRIGMASAKIKIELQTTDQFNAFGKDSIAFLIDANNAGQYNPIAKAASGGEMSRLLLAVKSIVSDNLSLPTLIFDEVDAAISGEAAKQVSLLMQSLATKHQVIVLTHQAQMAAKGHLHLFIYKEQADKNERIQTKVKILNKEERIAKIAQMIGGLEPGQAAVRSAEELLTY